MTKSQKQKKSSKEHSLESLQNSSAENNHKLIWTAKEIYWDLDKHTDEYYIKLKSKKQFLDADEVKRIVENTRLCHECDTLDCRYNKIIRERLIKRLKLK